MRSSHLRVATTIVVALLVLACESAASPVPVSVMASTSSRSLVVAYAQSTDGRRGAWSSPDGARWQPRPIEGLPEGHVTLWAGRDDFVAIVNQHTIWHSVER